MKTNSYQKSQNTSECSTCDFIEALEGLTDRVIATRCIIAGGYLVVGRLDEKFKQAGGVLARIHAKAEAKADSVIAREAVLEQRIETAFAPHVAMLDETEKGLDDVERQLATVTNGNPLPDTKTDGLPPVTGAAVGVVPQHPPGLTRGGVDFNK